MPKKIIENLEHPRDIAPAALQFLIHDGFQDSMENASGKMRDGNIRFIKSLNKSG